MGSNSMSLCRVCDRWFYENQGHTHEKVDISSILSQQIGLSNYHVKISIGRREVILFYNSKLHELHPFEAKYRIAYLGVRFKKCHFDSIQDCIDAAVNFLKTGVFDETRSA